jgi:hypothetical protein
MPATTFIQQFNVENANTYWSYWYNNPTNEGVLSINSANDLAHQHLKSKSNFNQHPQIRTTKDQAENLNFPFAIKTNSL